MKKTSESLTDSDVQDHATELRQVYDYDLPEDNPTWVVGNQLIQRFKHTFEEGE